MTIPKEIVEKMEQVNSLTREVAEWMYENLDTEDSKHENMDYYGEFRYEDYYQFTDKPKGTEQNDGEYVVQRSVGYEGDSFEGEYYYPTEKGNYFWFGFWV